MQGRGFEANAPQHRLPLAQTAAAPPAGTPAAASSSTSAASAGGTMDAFPVVVPQYPVMFGWPHEVGAQFGPAAFFNPPQPPQPCMPAAHQAVVPPSSNLALQQMYMAATASSCAQQLQQLPTASPQHHLPEGPAMPVLPAFHHRAIPSETDDDDGGDEVTDELLTLLANGALLGDDTPTAAAPPSLSPSASSGCSSGQAEPEVGVAVHATVDPAVASVQPHRELVGTAGSSRTNLLSASMNFGRVLLRVKADGLLYINFKELKQCLGKEVFPSKLKRELAYVDTFFRTEEREVVRALEAGEIRDVLAAHVPHDAASSADAASDAPPAPSRSAGGNYVVASVLPLLRVVLVNSLAACQLMTKHSERAAEDPAKRQQQQQQQQHPGAKPTPQSDMFAFLQRTSFYSALRCSPVFSDAERIGEAIRDYRATRQVGTTTTTTTSSSSSPAHTAEARPEEGCPCDAQEQQQDPSAEHPTESSDDEAAGAPTPSGGGGGGAVRRPRRGFPSVNILTQSEPGACVACGTHTAMPCLLQSCLHTFCWDCIVRKEAHSLRCCPVAGCSTPLFLGHLQALCEEELGMREKHADQRRRSLTKQQARMQKRIGKQAGAAGADSCDDAASSCGRTTPSTPGRVRGEATGCQAVPSPGDSTSQSFSSIPSGVSPLGSFANSECVSSVASQPAAPASKACATPQRTQYACKDCSMVLNSFRQGQIHINGQRHWDQVQRLKDIHMRDGVEYESPGLVPYEEGGAASKGALTGMKAKRNRGGAKKKKFYLIDMEEEAGQQQKQEE